MDWTGQVAQAPQRSAGRSLEQREVTGGLTAMIPEEAWGRDAYTVGALLDNRVLAET